MLPRHCITWGHLGRQLRTSWGLSKKTQTGFLQTKKSALESTAVQSTPLLFLMLQNPRYFGSKKRDYWYCCMKNCTWKHTKRNLWSSTKTQKGSRMAFSFFASWKCVPASSVKVREVIDLLPFSAKKIPKEDVRWNCQDGLSSVTYFDGLKGTTAGGFLETFWSDTLQWCRDKSCAYLAALVYVLLRFTT